MAKLQTKDRWGNYVFKKKAESGYPIETKVNLYKSVKSRVQWLTVITNPKENEPLYFMVIASTEEEAAQNGYNAYRLYHSDKPKQRKSPTVYKHIIPEQEDAVNVSA